MSALLFMLPVMFLVGSLIIIFFVWAVKSGQFEDIETQKYRIFFEEDK